jgi:hypothetical protein
MVLVERLARFDAFFQTHRAGVPIALNHFKMLSSSPAEAIPRDSVG